eukprot:7427543-Prorocentrum_lima.AAC.1
MTSSLVGSEMCIRDRQKHPGRTTVCRKRDCSLSKLNEMFPALVIKDSTPCLLYTSDAADDM